MVEVVGIKYRDPTREKERVLSELIPTRVVESIPQFQQSIYVPHLSLLWRIVSFLFLYLFLYTESSLIIAVTSSDHYSPFLQLESAFHQPNLPYEFSGNPTVLSVYFCILDVRMLCKATEKNLPSRLIAPLD